MNKKEEVYKFLEDITISQIKEKKEWGIDALSLSEKMMMDRANTSRMLNKLNQEGRVIKNQKRPVYYIARIPLQRINSSAYIPDVIPKCKKITDYISPTYQQQEHIIFQDAFYKFLPNNPDSSMYLPIIKAKAAICYPSHPLNIFLYGESNIGKFTFAKAINNYGIQKNIFNSRGSYQYIDCSVFETMNQENFLKILFGYDDGQHVKNGVFYLARNGLCIMNHMEKLSISTLNRICNTIKNRRLQLIGRYGKEYPINCTFIGIANDKKVYQSVEHKKSFPITIEIPSFTEKKIQEILVLTMQAFQEEANNIQNTIRLSKSLLSCFAMSEYKENIQQLNTEVRQTCAFAHYRKLTNNSIYIDIDYDDISNEVLSNIFDINERMNELNSILNLFEGEYLFFSPYTESKELQFLYDLNNESPVKLNSLNSNNSQLTMVCLEDINQATNIKLNTVRSVQIRELYDVLFPLLNTSSLRNNDNLQYGLLLHLTKTIKDVQAEKNITSDLLNIVKIAKQQDYELAKKIYKKIKNNYHILLPQFEIDYIATYLYLSSQKINNQFIQLLIVSKDNDISKEYAEYLNSRKSKITIHWLKIDSNKDIKSQIQKLSHTITDINRNKGVIIITEQFNLEVWDSQIQTQTDVDFLIIPNSSIQDIISIIGKIESYGITLQSLDIHEDETKKDSSIPDKNEEGKNFLNKLIDNLLSDSLNFINPYKVGETLYNVLNNIVDDLHIPYSDDLLVKFLFHGSFCIERCIRNEPFSYYKKARQIINKYDTIYYTVSKNMEVVCDLFNITIPASEMAMLVEIFILYYQNTANSE